MSRLASHSAALGRSLILAAAGALLAGPASAQLAEAPLQGAPVALADTTRRVPPTPPPLETPFALAQLRYDRVLDARIAARYEIKRLFRERGIRYPAASIYMRIFKRERALEVWVRPADADTFALLKSYAICALAGELGPKRRQGDLQVPEGFYYIDHFNPVSEFHLSLHVDYPNRSDAILGDTARLGGDIYIHGGCGSEGCIAVTDEGIKEIYWLSVEARGAGQQRIPVHIFPARLTDADMPRLEKAFAKDRGLLAFWKSLKPGFDHFESKHRVPRMSVADDGTYRVAGEERLDTPAPLGKPVERGPVPLGTPVGQPAVETATPAPAAEAPVVPVETPPAERRATPKGSPTPLGTPLDAKAPAPAGAKVEPKKAPVPLGKPVGGN